VLGCFLAAPCILLFDNLSFNLQQRMKNKLPKFHYHCQVLWCKFNYQCATLTLTVMLTLAVNAKRNPVILQLRYLILLW